MVEREEHPAETAAYAAAPDPSWSRVPPKGLELAFGCITDGLALFADFALKTPPTVGMNLRITARPVRDPAVNAAAARFMLDLFRADAVVWTAPDLLPDAGLVIRGANRPRADAIVIDQLELLAVLFDSLATIEQRFRPIDMPEQSAAGSSRR